MTWQDEILKTDLPEGDLFKTYNMIEYLRKHKNVLSIRGIEKHLGMPDSTLIKAVNGSQALGKKWQKPLEEFIKDLTQLP